MSRHDIALQETLALFRLAEQGETGVAEALEILRETFVQCVTGDSTRDPGEAEDEWERIVYGQRGHDLIASNPTPATLEQLLGKPIKTNSASSQVDMFGSEVPVKASEDQRFIADVMDVPLGLVGLQEPDVFDRVLMQEMGTVGAQTSWGPVDLQAILDGDLSPIEPTILHRDDGKALFYAGHVNALVGESESGKSWIALMACVEEMAGGKNVVFLDFEDSPRNVVARLLALGLEHDTLRRHFDYVGPDTSLGPVEKEELFGLLDYKRPSLIILDGVNAAMTLLGLDLNSNTEATQFYQWILKPLSSTGATVVTVDHVTKDTNTRGLYAIGAQAKRAMADGAMLGVSTVDRFGRGRMGKLNIEVLKDRNGGVLALSEKRGEGRREYLASAVIDAREEGKVKTRLVFESDTVTTSDEPDLRTIVRLRMYLVSAYVRDNGHTARSKIIKGVAGSNDITKQAIDKLVELGYLREVEGLTTGNNDTPSRHYRVVKPYTANNSVNNLMED